MRFEELSLEDYPNSFTSFPILIFFFTYYYNPIYTSMKKMKRKGKETKSEPQLSNEPYFLFFFVQMSCGSMSS